MQQRQFAKSAALLTGAALFVVYLAWTLAGDDTAGEKATLAAATGFFGQGGVGPRAPLHPAPPMVTARKLTAEDLEFLAGVRDKFSAHMHDKHAQIKSIEQLIAYLQAHYPQDWEGRIYDFLKQLFPALADVLHAKFQNLMRYNDWLSANREQLMRMSPAERRKALWDARHQAFGAEAEEIFAAQLKAERVRDSLAELELAQGQTVDWKLQTFMNTVHEAYGADAASYIDHRQTELMNGFLNVQSVQADLAAMSPPARGAALRDIRIALGMDDAALERWAALDSARDQTWDAGQQYMQERERIQSEYEGDEEQRRVSELQDRSFGDEAETIRNEEAAGFYRYSHQRRFGRE